YRRGRRAGRRGPLFPLRTASSQHQRSERPPRRLCRIRGELILGGIHLGQFVGGALMGIALVALGATLESGRPAAWARIGLASVVASIAVYAANQAVDGVSNHVMVHRLAAATGETRALVFEAAFAVRQIEVGLTSYFSLLFGATLVIFGLAMAFSGRYHNWLAVIGLLGGLGAVVIGLEQASNGF